MQDMWFAFQNEACMHTTSDMQLIGAIGINLWCNSEKKVKDKKKRKKKIMQSYSL